MLSELQQEIQGVVTGVLSGSSFALVGGAAIVSKGLVDRATNDLDYFTTDPAEIGELAPEVVSKLQQRGLKVEVITNSQSFVRLEITRGPSSTRVDLGLDARLFPVAQGVGLSEVSLLELGVDKVLAIFGRAELRDFTDLAAILQHVELEQLLELAPLKDPGFDAEVFRQMTLRLERRPRNEFDGDDVAFERLRSEVARWRRVALGVERGRDKGLDR